MVLLKRFFILAAAIHLASAVKPPNYIEKPKVPDKYPPKYEYNYFIANRHTQASQGHKEVRNGDNTRGNYFVNLPKGESHTSVNYIADEWGFFPVTRYSSRGPHHRVSGHFALGQHAVERLNETNLNTNEVFINQLSEPQQQATFPAAQVIYPKLPMIDNKPPQLSNIYASNQPNHDRQQQQFVFQSPGALYGNQPIPMLRNHEKHSGPLIFQHAQPMPIYQYAQQPVPPQINYFYQQQQQQQQQQHHQQAQKPQEVIYHQQPIASMASLQQYATDESHQQQQSQQFVIDESHQQHFSPTPLPLHDTEGGNINVDLFRASPQRGEEILPHQKQPEDGVKGNLIQVQPEAPNNVASDNQKQAKQLREEQSDDVQFQSPIVVDEQQINLANNETVFVQQKPNPSYIFTTTYQQPQHQVNIQILTDSNSNGEGDQYLRESSATPKIVNGHTNSNNFQYLVDDQQDQDRLDSTPAPKSEAPSRQFLKKFKNFRTYNEQSTSVSQSFSTSTSRSASTTPSESDENILKITQRPISSNFLAPVHVGVSLNNENMSDCLDGHVVEPAPVTEVREKNVNIHIEDTQRVPLYGEKIFASTQSPIPTHHVEKIFVSTPAPLPTHRIVHTGATPPQPILYEKQHHTEVVHQPIIVEKSVIKEVHVPFEKPVYIKSPPKIVDRPIYIKSQPQTQIVEKIVHHPVEVEKVIEQQVIVERPVIKEVRVPVEKTVYVQSPPETKIVHQPVIQTVEKPVYIEKIVPQPYEVEKIVEKFIDRPVIQTVEKPVYIEKFIDRPIEKIVEKPVIQTVERIVDRPVHVEKYIDRPYPVPYAVGVPYEKHIFHKPDFHVIAKSAPHKHKLFDFEGLFSFLGKKKEVKHIYVPSSQQHQLKQLGHHQLIASSITTIDPVKESPLFDYTRYATSHLNPIKPVYGVPSVPLAAEHSGYNYANPYAGKYSYDQGNSAIASIPASWVNDNAVAQSQAQSVHYATIPRDNYVGPTPLSDDYWAVNSVSTKEGIKFRRNVENGRSFRIEYGGFLPKMEPSLEIDENGKPLKKKQT